MTCLGWWSAEATTFVSGYISETEQAVNGVGFQILQILFMVSKRGVNLPLNIPQLLSLHGLVKCVHVCVCVCVCLLVVA